MSQNARRLTEHQAYAAMLEFLDAYWERGGRRSDDLAILLGCMTIDGGAPRDLALWSDWLSAIDKVGDGDWKA